MYNRYIPTGSGYTRVTEPDRQPIPSPSQGHRPPVQSQQRPSGAPDSSHPHRQQAAPPAQAPSWPEEAAPSRHQESLPPRQGMPADRPQRRPSQPPPPPPFSGKGSGLSTLMDMLRLDDLDSGDVLLILILLFLFRDGDDIELMITLGLILLLGLGEEGKKKEAAPPNT